MALVTVGVLWDTPETKADRIRKDLIKMFAEMGRSENYDSNQLKGGRLPRRDTQSVHKELLSIQEAKRSPNLHTQAVKPPAQHHQKSTCINQPPSHGHIEWQGILCRCQAPLRQHTEGKRVLWGSRIYWSTEEHCEREAEEPNTEDHVVQPSVQPKCGMRNERWPMVPHPDQEAFPQELETVQNIQREHFEDKL